MLLDQGLVVWQGEMIPFTMLLCMNHLQENKADACCKKKSKSRQFRPPDIPQKWQLFPSLSLFKFKWLGFFSH